MQKKESIYYRIPLLATLVSYIFLILSSRPTADEYLLAPVLRGYYVDQPEKPLFTPNEFGPLRYFQGAKAIVKLGWDSWLNAITFQMGTSTLTNYFGPIATISQGIVFAALVIWCCSIVTNHLVSNANHKSYVYCSFVVGLMMAMSIANFNTTRMHFGLYTFLGIRFGIYLVHALLLIAVVVGLHKWSLHKSIRKTGAHLALISLFCGMASLWYVLYLLLFVVCTIAVQLLRRRVEKFYWLVLINIIVSTYIFQDGLTGAKGRTTAASKTPIDILSGFINDVLLNRQSRLYRLELWQTVIGWQSIIGLGIGFLLTRFAKRRITWQKKNLRYLILSLLPSVMLLPVIFAFQEYITYEAWWHRTTPIVISYFLYLLLGIWIGVYVIPVLHKRYEIPQNLAVFLLIGAISVQPLADGFKSIDKFRSKWDSGNILAVGSPLENNADYNVINAFRISPYKNKNWDVQRRMIEAVPIQKKLMGINELPLSNEDKTLASVILETAASPFDKELLGSLTYRIQVTDKRGIGGVVSVTDRNGTTNHLIKSGLNEITELIGEINQPGMVILSPKDIASEKMDINLTNIGLGFSEDLRIRFEIAENLYIEKSN